MALCKLFEHGVTTNDVRLVSVKIRDLVEINVSTNSDRRRTRQSNGIQQQWIDVPGMFPVTQIFSLQKISNSNFILYYFVVSSFGENLQALDHRIASSKRNDFI